MKIADRFLRSPLYRPFWFGGGLHDAAFANERLSSAEAVIDVSNVAEYLHVGTDKEVWAWADDFPCMTPPFRRFVMTYRTPSRTRNAENGVRDLEASRDMLVVLSALDGDGGDFPDARRARVVAAKGAPRVLGTELFMSDGDGFLGPYLGMFLLDASGVPTRPPQFVFGNLSSVPDHAREALITLCDVSLFPIALALSFMHCKNARMVEQPIPPKLAKARARRGDPIPLLGHHTLEIEPMKRVLAEQGRAGEVGLQQALHICRGHFKDYRESGLFGHYKGLFWWDAHVRGSVERGVVAKDYVVGAPEPTP